MLINNLSVSRKFYRSRQLAVPTLEAEINKLVYALYGLSADDFAAVDGKEREKGSV